MAWKCKRKWHIWDLKTSNHPQYEKITWQFYCLPRLACGSSLFFYFFKKEKNCCRRLGGRERKWSQDKRFSLMNDLNEKIRNQEKILKRKFFKTKVLFHEVLLCNLYPYEFPACNVCRLSWMKQPGNILNFMFIFVYFVGFSCFLFSSHLFLHEDHTKIPQVILLSAYVGSCWKISFRDIYFLFYPSTYHSAEHTKRNTKVEFIRRIHKRALFSAGCTHIFYLAFATSMYEEIGLKWKWNGPKRRREIQESCWNGDHPGWSKERLETSYRIFVSKACGHVEWASSDNTPLETIPGVSKTWNCRNELIQYIFYADSWIPFLEHFKKMVFFVGIWQ